MIPVALFTVLGYALTYSGLSGLSHGALTGGNRQGLLACLGWKAGGASGFSPSTLLDPSAPSTATSSPAAAPAAAATPAPVNGPASGWVST